MPPPDLITIVNEPDPGDRFYYVGVEADGNQFMAFITGAFPNNEYPKREEDAAEMQRWYAVMHHFDAAGNHLKTDVYFAGTAADDEEEVAERALDKLGDMLTSLRKPKQKPILVKLFSHADGDYLFGLFYEQYGADSDAVVLQPNDVMFHEPWDGEYST